MELCVLAKVVMILSIISIALDMYLFGVGLITLLLDLIATFIFVGVTNWFCYSQGYNWISWVIVILTLLSAIGAAYIIKDQNSKYLKAFIDEEKRSRREDDYILG
jgi:cell division protein FtsW (lipid II flippase)